MYIFLLFRVRLSDGRSFIDSALSGPYILSKGQIISQEIHQSSKITKKNDIVTIEYFSKIDLQKMCNLQLIIRKI
jgi:membrane-anchored glycerophosphoryl diester phosphodiesterase (GDPDase)